MKVLAPLLLLLCGCATYGASQASLESNLRALIGQPVARAYDVLGLPRGKIEVDGGTVYTWSEENVISGYDVLDGDETTPLSCSVRLMVETGVIRRYTWTGNAGACDVMAKAIAARIR